MNSAELTKVLIFVGVYFPGYLAGGPVKTIANLVASLGDEFSFSIITTDRDLGSSEPYSTVRVDEWQEVGKSRVFYASPDKLKLLNFIQLIRSTQYDKIYLNSCFNFKFSIAPLIFLRLNLIPKAPVILAPRGEFSENALLLKRRKKRLFLNLAFGCGMFDGLIWQASTGAEAEDIKRVSNDSSLRRSPKTRIEIASDLAERVGYAEVLERPVRSEGARALRLCFLSRVVPMKNLDFAIRLLQEINVRIVFDIYGPLESSEYWSECQKIIEALPGNVTVSYMGSVRGDEVRSVIGMYDIFFVPSRGENFGHVFVEALSAGVPVLTSDRTPWRNLAALGVGWDISLQKPDDFVKILEAAAKFTDQKSTEMRAACRAYARKVVEDADTQEANRRLFLLAH